MADRDTLIVLLEELRAARIEFTTQLQGLREETRAAELRMVYQIEGLKSAVGATERKVEKLEQGLDKTPPPGSTGPTSTGSASVIAKVAAGAATVVAAIYWAIINFKPPGG